VACFFFGFWQGATRKKIKKATYLPTYLFFKKPQKTRPIFYRVFELPSPRNAQKRDKNYFEKKSVLDFWSKIFVKTFRHDFFAKRFL
jgi:hypothetical protein